MNQLFTTTTTTTTATTTVDTDRGFFDRDSTNKGDSRSILLFQSTCDDFNNMLLPIDS